MTVITGHIAAIERDDQVSGVIVQTVSSMTGFARTEGSSAAGYGWVWEIKSVNGKALDFRFRLPPGFDALEASLKARAIEVVKRGSITANLAISATGRSGSLKINEAVLSDVIAMIRSLEGRIDAAPPRLDGLLSIRGVIEAADESPSDEEKAELITQVTVGFEQVLVALGVARVGEGERIAGILTTRLDEIEALIAEADLSAAVQPDSIRKRFQTQLATLLGHTPPVPEDRLAQELALLIQRADVREELDRLGAHCAAARSLLEEGHAIGRRLDFLCQEFNREANTLCSKSAELGLTRIGLALKAAVEQLREQVQNIE